MNARCLLPLVVLGACSSDSSTYPTPVLPKITGWEALQTEVVDGEYAKFKLTLDWGGPMPVGLEWHTAYDLYAEHAGGLPVDPANDPIVTRDGDNGEIVELPTKGNIYRHIEAGQYMYVCQDRENGDCVEAFLDRAYAVAAGGKTVSVDFPFSADVQMVVGERRAMQAVPIAQGEESVRPSQDPVMLYLSENTDVLDVDPQGVVEAKAIGFTFVEAHTASGGYGRIGVAVIAGTGAPLQGATLATDRPTLSPFDKLNGRTPHTFAMTPAGNAAFVLDPDVATPEHSGISSERPLYLYQWTGAGLGFERINEWWERARAPFFDVSGSGHQVVGWVAHRGTGLTVLDRPGTAITGGWQRRRLPMRVDLSTGAEREHGPNVPSEWQPNNTGIEELNTMANDNVAIGTWPDADGVWVAYGWAASLYHLERLPRFAETRCVQIVRLAHISPSKITVEDAWFRFWQSDEADFCENLVEGSAGGEELEWINVGPPEDGSDRPTLLVDTYISPVGHVLRKLQHTATGWAMTYRSGAHDPGDSVTLMPEWNIDDPTSTRPLASASTSWWTVGAGGALCNADARIGPYGNGMFDSVTAPSWGTALNETAGETYMGGGGGYGQAAVLMKTPPLWDSQTFSSTWLYQQPLVRAPRPSDADTIGTRLSSVAVTPKYESLVVLANGTRVLVQRPHGFMDGLGASRSTAAGQPFSTQAAVTGVSVSTIDKWIAWGDANRVLLAQGSGPVSLSVSTDAGASFSALSTPVPSMGPPIKAISTSPGVTWLLTSKGGTAAQLWRLDDTGGSMTVTAYTAGSWPNMSDSDETTILYSGGTLYVLTWVQEAGTGKRFLVTRRYAPNGAVIGAAAEQQEEYPVLALAGITGSGVLVVPLNAIDTVNEKRHVLRSTNAGVNWVTAMDVPALVGDVTWPAPVQLADGRLAVVVPVRTCADQQIALYNCDGQQAALLTTSDGVTWSTQRLIRPTGGHVQRAWLTALDGSGDLLVHLGDSGTMAGWLFASCADITTTSQTGNPTCLEGLFLRIVAP